jgi:hypothetical protein
VGSGVRGFAGDVSACSARTGHRLADKEHAPHGGRCENSAERAQLSAAKRPPCTINSGPWLDCRMAALDLGKERALALQTSLFRVGVNVLGAVVLLAYLVLTLLSYPQTPALWRHHADVPHATAFFQDFAAKVPLVGLSSLFETNAAVIVSYCVPVGIVTIAWIALVAILYRREHTLSANIDALLMRWSVAFAVVGVLAFPLFTQDFWLSMAWGRMAAEGTNPYHNLFTDETLTGLPLDHFPMAMSYGPAWAILSGAVMAVTGKSVLAATILFKGVLLAAWLGSLVLIRRITAPQPVLDRCLAVAVAGWLAVASAGCPGGIGALQVCDGAVVCRRCDRGLAPARALLPSARHALCGARSLGACSLRHVLPLARFLRRHAGDQRVGVPAATAGRRSDRARARGAGPVSG